MAEHLTNSFISDCLELARAKAEYETKNPITKKGNINRLPECFQTEAYEDTFMNFTDYTAKRLGKNRRMIQNEIRIGEKLNPEVYQAVIDLGLSKAEIYVLSGLSHEIQQDVTTILQREPEQNIKEIAEALKHHEKPESCHKNNPLWGRRGYNVVLIEGEAPEELPVMGNCIIFFVFPHDDLHIVLSETETWRATATDLLTIDRPGKKPVLCLVLKQGRPIIKPFRRFVFRCREADKLPEDFYREIELATVATKNRIAYFQDKSHRRRGWNCPE